MGDQEGETFLRVMLLLLLTRFNNSIAFLVLRTTYLMREFSESSCGLAF